jgi:hypothetical protein
VQQRAGVAGSPTPGKPELPHEPGRVPGPTPGRPVVSGGQGGVPRGRDTILRGPQDYPAGFPDGRNPESRDLGPANLSNDVRRVVSSLGGEPRGPRPAGNLATGRPYQQPQAHMPEGPGLPGKPNLGGLVKQPHLPQLPGRPQVDPLDEQLAAQHVQALGQTRSRPRARRGAQLLSQILGGFSRR